MAQRAISSESAVAKEKRLSFDMGSGFAEQPAMSIYDESSRIYRRLFFDVPVLIIKDSRNARREGLESHLFYSVAFLGNV